VLRATDDIAALLDDQLATTQSMRGSPFVKPLEKDVKNARLSALSCRGG
jgi:dynein heavy chain